MTDIYPVPPEVQELRDEVGRLLELLAQAAPSRPWQVVGEDPLPEPNKPLHLTLETLNSKDLFVEVGRWTGKEWQGLFGRNLGEWFASEGYFKILAWQPYPKPWQRKSPGTPATERSE